MKFWDKILGRATKTEKDLRFGKSIKSIIGAPPKNLQLYKLATLHSSVGKVSKDGFRISNERLEYLGDAILSMVIAEYLFKKYPFKEEGFLTEIRSRIVKRVTLNKLAKKLGISDLVKIQDANQKSHSIYGNALEAVIGAVFLDRGYVFCKQFILKKIVKRHLNMKKIIHTDTNYKSKIIEWAQKENKQIVFESESQSSDSPSPEFQVTLLVDDQLVATGSGTSKKRAEQNAALKACEQLKLL